MMSLLHMIFVLATAISAFPSGVVAEPCRPKAHAEMVLRYCFPGGAPSLLCCNALFGSLASGMGCVCNITHTRLIMSAGLSADDVNGWFATCGGNGDELARVCSVGQGDLPSLPPAPPAQDRPHPPPDEEPLPVPAQPHQAQGPWFAGLVKVGLIFLFILVVLFGLLAVVAYGGPAGVEASKLLATGRNIAKGIARRLNIPGWVQGSSSRRTPPAAPNMVLQQQPARQERALQQPDLEMKKHTTCTDGTVLSAPVAITEETVSTAQIYR